MVELFFEDGTDQFRRVDGSLVNLGGFFTDQLRRVVSCYPLPTSSMNVHPPKSCRRNRAVWMPPTCTWVETALCGWG